MKKPLHGSWPGSEYIYAPWLFIYIPLFQSCRFLTVGQLPSSTASFLCHNPSAIDHQCWVFASYLLCSFPSPAKPHGIVLAMLLLSPGTPSCRQISNNALVWRQTLASFPQMVGASTVSVEMHLYAVLRSHYHRQIML